MISVCLGVSGPGSRHAVTMVDDLVPDSLWERVALLLPTPMPRPRLHNGRRRLDDRAALAGIVFVLKHGVGWAQVPKQALGVSGVTCWRRLREWTRRLLELDDMCVVWCSIGQTTASTAAALAPSIHLIVDGNGVPLQVTVIGGNRHDVTQMLPLIDSLPRIKGVVGRPRHKPKTIYADRGYDYDKYRRELRRRGIARKIARRGEAHGSGLGKKVGRRRGFAWLHHFKRLRTRYEVRADLHLGLIQLACAIICWRKLTSTF